MPSRRRGRPTEYDPAFDRLAYHFTLLGATDDELAAALDVSPRTINYWKKEHPEFLQSIREGKLRADGEVVDRLRQRALGFEYDKAVPIKLKEVLYAENGKRASEIERVEVVMVHEVVPPDTPALMFWLKNRRPRDWRDKHEFTGADGGPLEVKVTHEIIDPPHAR